MGGSDVITLNAEAAHLETTLPEFNASISAGRMAAKSPQSIVAVRGRRCDAGNQMYDVTIEFLTLARFLF